MFEIISFLTTETIKSRERERKTAGLRPGRRGSAVLILLRSFCRSWPE